MDGLVDGSTEKDLEQLVAHRLEVLCSAALIVIPFCLSHISGEVPFSLH